MSSRRRLLAAAAALVALPGCGGAGEPAAGAAPAAEHVRGSIDVSRPRGWRLLEPPIAALSYPVERLLLTSYPAGRGGNCAPDSALRALPAGGALVYLFEYRPADGAVWSHVHRRAFPRRPAHFALRHRDLALYECWRRPSYLIRFRAADRPFQLHVALGARVMPARRAQVLRVLDSLRFGVLPAPRATPAPRAGSAAAPRGSRG